MSWVFERSRKMGGATGSAYTGTFNATGMNKGGKLAREAIQNSVDAGLNPDLADQKVGVEFRRLELTGADRERFLSALELQGEFSQRASLGGIEDSVLNDLSIQGEQLELLFVDDFNTTGLDGDPHSDESNFHRLLFTMGDGSKTDEGRSTGGSYGFGKTVYPSSSRAKLIVAFTLTKDNEHRLFGCSFFKKHRYNEHSYTGRGWFGYQNRNENDQEVVYPYVNDDAVELAKKLGFKERRKGLDFGTSILIVDCQIGIDEIRDSVERWWWPRLVEDLLDVSLYLNDEVQGPPRPKKRNDLLPFIRSYNIVTQDPENMPEHQRRVSFRRWKGLNTGAMGLTMLGPEAEDSVDDESLDETLNSVALIRSPRMVVDYFKVQGGAAPYKGAFFAHSEIDDILRLSEPLAHNLWDSQSDRLNLSNDEPKLIDSIHSRIRRGVSNFLEETAPPVEPNAPRLSALEKALGKALRPRLQSGSSNPNDGQYDPVSINFLDFHNTPVGTQLKSSGVVKLKLTSRADFDESEATLRLRVSAVEDGVGRSTKYLQISAVIDDQELMVEDGMAQVMLQKDRDTLILFETEVYPPDWTLNLEVEVQGEE